MNINSLLQGVLGEQLIEGIVSKLGVENNAVKKAIAIGIPLLLMALKRNSQTPEGANGIFGALKKKHDGGLLDNLGDLFGSNHGHHHKDGKGILSHILGDKQSSITHSISQQSGLSTDKVMGILTMVAPVVMAMLGKEKNNQNAESGQVGGLIETVMGSVQQSDGGESSMLEKLLDRDGDGNSADDIMDIGSKLLGGLFGGKK